MSLFVLMAALVLAPVDPIPACEARLLSYADWTETADTRWNFEASIPGGGGLTYFGAEHSRDPAHAQFAAIDAAFKAVAPTVVFYEGPDRGVADDGAATIASRGESGYVRFLASQSGIRIAPLEPSPINQLKGLAERFPADQVYLFFTLREAARLRDRESLTGEALHQAMTTLLSRAGAMAVAGGFTPPFSDLAGLQAAYAKYWPAGPDWRAAPSNWFSPSADDAATGGIFMGRINAASSEVRNLHMYRVLARAALSGEKVFAVVGRNHVPMQAPALACAL